MEGKIKAGCWKCPSDVVPTAGGFVGSVRFRVVDAGAASDGEVESRRGRLPRPPVLDLKQGRVGQAHLLALD
ncbi:hypothetical protein [Spirosoma koreense]